MLIVGWACLAARRLWQIETNEYGNRFLAAKWKLCVQSLWGIFRKEKQPMGAEGNRQFKI